MRLIDVDEITDSEIANCLGAEYCSCVPDVRDMLNEQPTAREYRCIAAELDGNQMKLKEFLEKIYTGKHVRIYVDGRATVAGTTRQVLMYLKWKQLSKSIKQIAPVNDEMIDIAI